MTPGSTYTFAIFIDNGHMYSKCGGAKCFENFFCQPIHGGPYIRKWIQEVSMSAAAKGKASILFTPRLAITMLPLGEIPEWQFCDLFQN